MKYTLLTLICMVLLSLTLTACGDAVSAELTDEPTAEVTEPATDVAQAATSTTTATATATTTATATATNTATPLPTAELPPACTPRTDWLLYTVVRGDTLGTIARRVNSTVNALAVANCIANPNNITVGQQLRVPRLPATPTNTQAPARTVYRSTGRSTSFACAVFVNGATAPLYQRASLSEPLNADLGNWAEWVRTIDGFYQVNIYPDNTASFISAYVNTNDVTRAGTGCDTVNVTGTPAADIWITQGSIFISSYIRADAGNYQLRGGETITLRWDNAPEALLQARFYTVSNTTGVRDEIGMDNNPGDGLSISWTVPAVLDGAHQLFAEGAAANAAAYDFARSFEQTIYVPAAVAEPECPPTSNTGTGNIDLSPVDGVQGRCQTVQGNRTLSVIWNNLPADVNRIEYYFVPVAGSCGGAALGNPGVIGTINDISQGTVITWNAAYTSCTGIVYAFGYTSSSMVESQQRPVIFRQ